MDWVRSLRIGCGMISRGEVGLIVTAMGASTGIFGKSEVAVMVAVVLLTTLLTPLGLRGAYNLKAAQDVEERLDVPELVLAAGYDAEPAPPNSAETPVTGQLPRITLTEP